jgi:hypothetical protein
VENTTRWVVTPGKKTMYQKECTRKECGKSVHCEMKHFLIALKRIHTNLGGKPKKTIWETKE